LHYSASCSKKTQQAGWKMKLVSNEVEQLQKQTVHLKS